MLAIWNILLYSVAIKILNMLYTIKLFKEKQELTHIIGIVQFLIELRLSQKFMGYEMTKRVRSLQYNM